MTAVRVEFPYLKEDTDRHGNVRIYVRRGGCKIRIREPKGSPGFARVCGGQGCVGEPDRSERSWQGECRASGYARSAGG
jgi:hypothetical protein